MKRKLTFVLLLLSALLSPVTRATVYNGFLFSNKAPSMLAQGDSLDNGSHVLVMQTDGNLVFYRKTGMVPVWWTGVYGDYAVIQGDGNFVVYNKAGQAVWSSGSYGPAGVYLLTTQLSQAGDSVVILRSRDDGNYDQVWQSKIDPKNEQGCPGGSNPQQYPVCINGMTFNLPMCSQADAAAYAHQQGGYYGACH
ncbi:hypothetical protein GJ698_02205 [Pseudoduganella sp. FT26W]|uniref:Bulb-type lectin domain-containing protein n=1 Tax=Duganella aquatilis TaxID=2666082 RepID=A0A844D2K0_9BURK|nr:hypothetical protein [Duganella aquatilis]MRW82902.1 hypothetical protein [Duganella aquatilis]